MNKELDIIGKDETKTTSEQDEMLRVIKFNQQIDYLFQIMEGKV